MVELFTCRCRERSRVLPGTTGFYGCVKNPFVTPVN